MIASLPLVDHDHPQSKLFATLVTRSLPPSTLTKLFLNSSFFLWQNKIIKNFMWSQSQASHKKFQTWATNLHKNLFTSFFVLLWIFWRKRKHTLDTNHYCLKPHIFGRTLQPGLDGILWKSPYFSCSLWCLAEWGARLDFSSFLFSLSPCYFHSAPNISNQTPFL